MDHKNQILEFKASVLYERVVVIMLNNGHPKKESGSRKLGRREY